MDARQVTVLGFGAVRDVLGAERLVWALPEGTRVQDLLESLERTYPTLHAHRSRLAYAVNAQWSNLDSVLKDGDELALLSPVSGG